MKGNEKRRAQWRKDTQAYRDRHRKTPAKVIHPLGLNIPMIDPICIPYGYLQHFSTELNDWVLIPRTGKVYY